MKHFNIVWPIEIFHVIFKRNYLNIRIYNLIYNYINSIYLTYRTYIFLYLINNYYFVLNNFLLNCKKGNIIFVLEQLIIDIYPIIMPTLLNLIYLIFLTFLAHSGTFIDGELLNLNLEINQMICKLLYSYLGFLLSLDVIYLIIIKGDKLKNNYSLVYNGLILIFLGGLVIFTFLFLYNLNGLCINIISLTVKYIWGFIVKMMANPGSAPSGPGGFGQPVGGGGRPPKKPGGPQPSNPHYEDKGDKPKQKRANYSKMTVEEIKEHKKKLRADKNKRRREIFDSKTEEEKEEIRAHERKIKSELKESLPLDEVDLRKEIYNEKRRERYAEDAPWIKERRKEIFDLKDEEDKEFIRENDRERYHNSTYMREQKRINKRKSRANKKKEG